MMFCLLALSSLTAVSAAQSSCPSANSNVLTWHNDINRTGWQCNEATLNQTNVTANGNSFGLLWQLTVTGSVYAQPLAVTLTQKAGSCQNPPCSLVLVATENDLLYAFDAATGASFWSTDPVDLAGYLGGSAVNCSTVSASVFPVCGGSPLANNVYVGVTGTPVIDMSATPDPLLYVVAAVYYAPDTPIVVYHLFAVDITTGAVEATVAINGSVAGQVPANECKTSSGSGNIIFTNASIQRQGLLLLNGTVYIAFADFPEGLGDNGWIFGYQLQNSGGGSYSFSQTAVANSTAFGSGGGFWGSGAAPASDGTNIYTTTGNGTFDVNNSGADYGDSLLRLKPSSFWPPADWYTPSDVFSYTGIGPNGKPCKMRCECDEDLSSGGVLVVPSAYTYTCTGSGCAQCANGTKCNVVINGDKESKIYVANQLSLGHFNNTDQNIEVVQTPYPTLDTYQGYWASPAYWNDGMNNNWIFYSATDSQGGDPPFPIDGYELTPSGTAGSYNPVPQTPNASTVSSTGSPIGFCQYSPTPSVSSGASASSGIVWAIEQPNSGNPSNNNCAGTNSKHAVLHAFCATAAGGRCTTALTELYNSTQNVTKTLISKDVTFSTPTIFNGRVYMGTRTEVGAAQSEVDVFGLCSGNGPSGCLQ